MQFSHFLFLYTNITTNDENFLSFDNRELKNHDEVHEDDVYWLGKDWNENVSFGGKKET